MKNCKTCSRFKKSHPLDKAGECSIVYPFYNPPEDADSRIGHLEVKEVKLFFVNRSKVFVGENFGCIHHKE
jgi:hypothetical protein